MTEVIFRPVAELELQEAHEWYEEREPGLGSELVRCINACVQTIRRHPEIYPIVHRNVRQGVLKHFPYSILYFVSNDGIIVISVFHASRDPKLWKRRA